MLTTTKSTAFAHPVSGLAEHDATWYGTLGVLVAGLFALAGLVFTL